MHELSVALGIVKIAEQEARKAGVRQVKKITLDIGYLAGVEFEALDFAWPLAVKDTVLEGAERVINKIAGRARCLECDKQYALQHLYDGCPYCGSYFKDIMKGKELLVRSLELSMSGQDQPVADAPADNELVTKN